MKALKPFFLFIISALSLVVFAANNKTSFQDGTKHWEVEIKNMRGLDTLIIQEKTSDKTLSYQSNSIAHSFVRMSSLTFSKNGPLYLVSVWKKGAHGESIKVLDTSASNSKELVAFSYNSAWPLEYEFKDGELVIYGKGAMQEDGTPEEEVRRFVPKEAQD